MYKHTGRMVPCKQLVSVHTVVGGFNEDCILVCDKQQLHCSDALVRQMIIDSVFDNSIFENLNVNCTLPGLWCIV